MTSLPTYKEVLRSSYAEDQDDESKTLQSHLNPIIHPTAPPVDNDSNNPTYTEYSRQDHLLNTRGQDQYVRINRLPASPIQQLAQPPRSPTLLVPRGTNIYMPLPEEEVLADQPPPPGFESLCEQPYVNVFMEFTCSIGPILYHIEREDEVDLMKAQSTISCCQYSPSSFIISNLCGDNISSLDTSEHPYKVAAPMGCTIGYIKEEYGCCRRKLVVMSPSESVLFKINMYPRKTVLERFFYLKDSTDPELPSFVSDTRRSCGTYNISVRLSPNLNPYLKVMLVHAMLVVHSWAKHIQ